MGLFSSEISTKTMVPLCRQLATAYDAGIPILKSFEMVTSQSGDRRVKQVITDISDDIKNGSTLADASRAQSRFLPSFFIELMATGEHGGKLDIMLRDLADYFEDKLSIQREVRRALAYPAMQLTFAWFLGTFAMGLLNQLDFSSTEPFKLSEYIAWYVGFQIRAMIIVGLVFAGCVILSRLGIFGWIWGAGANYIWPFSKVTQKFGLARFFRSMSLLIGSGLRIDHCVRNSAAVTANPYMERDLLKAVPLVKDGSTLVEAFATSRHLTPTAREMILVGEQSGNLEVSFQKVSQMHLDEATHAVNIMVKVMNVIMVLAVALTIGYVIITFWTRLYGAMFNELGI
jgi:type IV pilus assembly protein PilC